MIIRASIFVGGACHAQYLDTVAGENSSSVLQEEHNNTTPGRWQIRERLHHCKDTTVAALKGWIKQETVVLIKLAIPIVSFLTYISKCVWLLLLPHQNGM